jgi:hypothetical protein
LYDAAPATAVQLKLSVLGEVADTVTLAAAGAAVAAAAEMHPSPQADRIKAKHTKMSGYFFKPKNAVLADMVIPPAMTTILLHAGATEERLAYVTEGSYRTAM